MKQSDWNLHGKRSNCQSHFKRFIPFNDCHHTCECFVSGKIFEWEMTLKRMSFEHTQKKKTGWKWNKTERVQDSPHFLSLLAERISIVFDSMHAYFRHLNFFWIRKEKMERKRAKKQEREKEKTVFNRIFIIAVTCLHMHKFHQKISYFLF